MHQHTRTLIREKIKEKLDGKTQAKNVYVNRETPSWQADVPCIIIYSGDEQADPRNINARQFIRNFEVKLEVQVESNDTVDEDLDIICKEIEDILVKNYSLDGLALDMLYKTSSPLIDASGEKIVGVMTLTYEVKYIQ